MPDWAWTIVVDFWAVLSDMAPYLLFGFLVAGLLSALVSPSLVERHLGGRGPLAVAKAAMFGVPLPLCSCGVIPVAASLRRHGAGRGPTVSFLVATPQTGVDSILVTYSLLGGVFAVFRPLFALLTGMLGGWLVSIFDRNGVRGGESAETCQDPCCTDQGSGRVRKVLRYGFVTLPRDIGRSLLIGLVAAALISALVPKDYFANFVPPGHLQLLILMLAGIPVYVCATASVPLAYALILAGVSPGAAFAFLMTGPATNAATIVTIWKVLGRRTGIIYLAVMMAGAYFGGLLLDQLVTPQAVQAATHTEWMLPTVVRNIAAVALLALLLAAVLRPRRTGRVHETSAAQKVALSVTGMTCSHCAENVRQALLACGGVREAEVDLSHKRAEVAGEALDVPAMCQAIEAAGFSARPEEGHP